MMKPNETMTLHAHVICAFCGKQKTWESNYDDLGEPLKGDVPRRIIGFTPEHELGPVFTVHSACDAAMKKICDPHSIAAIVQRQLALYAGVRPRDPEPARSPFDEFVARARRRLDELQRRIGAARRGWRDPWEE